ncbi:MAG: hypothetical protein ACRD9R_05685 [Pyrinomonadaceae bacterium]
MSEEGGFLRREANAKKLDFSAMLRAVLPPFITWATAVIFVSFVGRQPGVVCVTPVAWLMACWVGVSCVARSRSESKSALLTEAGLAGGVLGLLQGVLFAAIVPFMGVRPDEQQKSMILSGVMIAVGALVSAVLSAAVGAAAANRRAAK